MRMVVELELGSTPRKTQEGTKYLQDISLPI